MLLSLFGVYQITFLNCPQLHLSIAIYYDLCPSRFSISFVLANEPHFFLTLSPFPSDNSLHSDEQLLAEVARRKLDLHDKITDAVVRETYDFGKVGKTNVSQLDHFLID